MYILKPELVHEQVVLDFVKRCASVGDRECDVCGSQALAAKMHEGGYSAWLKQTKANALAREWHSKCGLEPGNTLLLVERVSGHADVSEEYLQQFPMLSEEERLVGIVTICPVLEDMDSDTYEGDNSDGAQDGSAGSAILRLCLIPCYRDTINFILALTDSMTYVVCEGLPFKHLVYWLQDGAERDAMTAALRSCNFDYKSTHSVSNADIYWADLRTAHQLRDRICEFRRKEE